MKQLVFHIGLPKTGTTSIQSTLFWSPPKEGFRLVTLDNDFGNQLVLSAFQDGFGSSDGYFRKIMSMQQVRKLQEFQQKYLAKNLADCCREGLTPVFSAEMASGLLEPDLRKIKEMAAGYGYRVRVIGYVRPLLDYIESAYQQSVRVGANLQIADAINRVAGWLGFWNRFDTVFGRENVDLHLFDRQRFPGQCVVRDFCGRVGIDTSELPVIRENESMNLNILRFLLVWNKTRESTKFGFASRVRRRTLRDGLQGLPGPPLRFGSSIAERIEREAAEGIARMGERLGESYPLTTVQREREPVIDSEEEMSAFTEESLDWLSRGFTKRLTGIRENDLTGNVLRRLNLLSLLPDPDFFPKWVAQEWNIRVHRRRLLNRWMQY